MELKLSDLQENKPFRIERNGVGICVAKVKGEVFAINDTCSHSDASLSEGDIVDGKIECWLHGAQFDLKTGEAVTPPATIPVATYEVFIEGDLVKIGEAK
jgi:3-phenylpropionate/trans-cinnamate dioxygenase ferredoxin subunit